MEKALLDTGIVPMRFGSLVALGIKNSQKLEASS
jgi:hypothetical protein